MKKLVSGLSASKGISNGKCKIVNSMDDFVNVERGDILVTKNTDPSFVCLFSKVVGIITDVGGLCSHAAIVSREMGIPCIVGTGDASKILRNGQKVIVNADEGIVYDSENE
jgi:pyruvate, water dikinase